MTPSRRPAWRRETCSSTTTAPTSTKSTVSSAPGDNGLYCTTTPLDTIYLTLADQDIPNVTPGASGSVILISTAPYAAAAAINTALSAGTFVAAFNGLADGTYFLTASALPLAAGTYYFTNYVYGDTLADVFLIQLVLLLLRVLHLQ